MKIDFESHFLAKSYVKTLYENTNGYPRWKMMVLLRAGEWPIVLILMNRLGRHCSAGYVILVKPGLQ